MPSNKADADASAGSRDHGSLLSPVAYDDDASSIHSRSDQDTDSDDDELQSRARNKRELLAADRIVLMEEDELDRLVTDSRKEKDRQRRGSGLSVPKSLKIFGRQGSSSQSNSVAGSTEDMESDKRKARRARRKERKERLMEDAQHGEDGELMYEMEEGGMREGDSTGESSDRDDSDEVDRLHLNSIANAKAGWTRSWPCWLVIITLISVGFALLILWARKLSSSRHFPSLDQDFVSNGTALFAPTTVLISLDGFRADFLNRGLTPRLSAFIKEGVSPKYMLPSFPSVTFPNHYTIATGLYPESHGVVGNSFWDPYMKAEFYYTDPGRSLDPKWWSGEPFWVTAENQGIRTAIHMWPGSEAHIMNMEPSFMDKFNGSEALPNKVSRIFEFLDKPGKEDKYIDPRHMRPQLIAAYVPNVDSDGHRYGPNSTQIRSTISDVDNLLDQVFVGLENRNLTHIVNVIVVSDHGMATTDTSRLVQLEDIVDTSKIEHTDGWPLYGLRPKNPDDLQELYDELIENTKSNPNIAVYLRDVNMPERYHFSKNDRIAPLWVVPAAGWAVVTKDKFDVQMGIENSLVYTPRGLHGYDHEHPLMRAIFVARGPAFPHPANSEIGVFQNTEVYNILCDSVGINPKPNNGTLRLPLTPIGLHNPDQKPDEPEDPVRPTPPEKPTEPVKSEKPEQPQPPQQPEQPTQATDPEAPLKEPSAPPEGDHGSDGDKPEGLWDWISGEVEKLWNKITGSG